MHLDYRKGNFKAVDKTADTFEAVGGGTGTLLTGKALKDRLDQR
jgi:hypothetical protein